MGVGGLASVVQAGLGFAVAAAFGDHRIVAMSLLLALPLPLVGAGGAMQGLLTRNRDYRTLAGRAVIGQGLGTLTGIGCALAGAGAWALVAQQIVSSCAGALSLLLRSRWRPRPIFQWRAVRALLAVGVPLTASTLVQNGRYRVFALLLGGTAGAAVLGQVHLAFRLVDTVRDLAITALWRLILPSLSECQHDLVVLHARLARAQALSALILFPAVAAMLLCLHPLVRLLLGPVWEPASDAASVLLLLACWTFLAFPTSVGVVARGAARVALIGNTLTTALILLAVLLVRPQRPMQAAWLWVAAQVALIPYTLLTSARVLQAGVWTQLRFGVPALLVALLAAAVGWLVPAAFGQPDSDLLLMAERLLIAAAVYVPGSVLVMRDALRDALEALGGADVT
jgi:PST family polysaccharide transporter